MTTDDARALALLTEERIGANYNEVHDMKRLWRRWPPLDAHTQARFQIPDPRSALEGKPQKQTNFGKKIGRKSYSTTPDTLKRLQVRCTQSCV